MTTSGGSVEGRAAGAARALARALATVALLAVPTSAAAVVLPDPGRAVDDSLAVAQNGNGGLDVLANDVIPYGGSTLETLSGPAHGRIEGRMGSPGWYQYYPAAGFAGADSFRYQLSFDDGTVSVGTVRITVVGDVRTTTTTTSRARPTTTSPTASRTTTAPTRARTTTRAATTTGARRTATTTTARRTTSTAPAAGTGPPRAPLAADDSTAADLGSTVVIRVLDNDRAPGGRLVPGSVRVVTAPRHGTATANPDGTISYAAGAEGTALDDRFEYRVADPSGAGAQARVTVRLREPDDLLDGRTSSVPGASLELAGQGCGSGEAVRIELDGAVAARTVARPDGAFSTGLAAPERLGRYRLRAVCDGQALVSWLDVVQTTSAETSGRAAVAAGVLATVGAVLSFYLLTGILLAPPRRRPAYGADTETDPKTETETDAELELGPGRW